jgi:hypothetical protein
MLIELVNKASGRRIPGAVEQAWLVGESVLHIEMLPIRQHDAKACSDALRRGIVLGMDAPWRRKDLPEIGRALAQRPGHESVRTLVAEILRHAFGAGYLDLDHEVRMPELRGRADTLFGATVFEFKRDLRREMEDVHARLPDYLRERERQTGRRYLGIATDGATFIAFELRDGRMLYGVAAGARSPIG